MASSHLKIWLCIMSAILGVAGGQDGNGLYDLVLKSDLINCILNKSLELDVNKLKLYMYDFENEEYSSYYLDEAAEQILASCTFDPTRRMLFYIPAFSTTINDTNSKTVRDNLKHVPSSYVFFVEHSHYTHLSSELGIFGSYERCVKYYWAIGRAIAEFLVDFVDGGVTVDLIHLMGHSIGGHIVAAAGEHYYNTTGELLPRVTGIDPTGLCFSEADTEYQIRSGIALQVESYNCDVDEYGNDNNLSDVNFYLNGGLNQPGCVKPAIGNLSITAEAAVCSHLTCSSIYTFSARQKYQAVQCDSYAHFKDGACSSHHTTIAGYYSPSDVTGVYYSDTN